MGLKTERHALPVAEVQHAQDKGYSTIKGSTENLVNIDSVDSKMLRSLESDLLTGWKIKSTAKLCQPTSTNYIKSIQSRRNQLKVNKTLNASNDSPLMDERLVVGNAVWNQYTFNQTVDITGSVFKSQDSTS